MTLYSKMRQIFLQNAAKVYYKKCQVFYYKMPQFYYKIRQLLQNVTILLLNATFITKCVGTQPDARSAIPHINFETNPLRPIINLVCKYLSLLAQASVLLLCQYAAILSRGKGPDSFLQSGPFQNSHKFFQELTWSQ